MAFACLVTALIAERACAEIEPYEARVTTPRALVHSGPGERFYPTATLSPDDSVEVYREEADGWLGIRPPEDSFSWIPEKQLKLKGGGLAEVREEDVASRIGSQLSDKRNAVQVRLKKGEVVEIVGKETFDGETWYRIAPPAGEFRWIHAASVERRGSIGENESPGEGESHVVPASATSESAPEKVEVKPEAVSPPAAEAPRTTGESWRASSVPDSAAAAEVTPPPLTPLVTSTPPSPTSTPAAAAPPAAAIPSAAPSATVTPSATAAPAPTEIDLPRQLTDIELRLSRMASAPPQLWNTERLQRDTEQLLGKAQTQAERDMVKVTMAKIDHFTALARRYQQPATRTAVAGLSEAGVQRAGVTDPSYNTVDADRFDATGILRPVVSKRPGAPQFALVDERGQVVTFVTPTPDVNLQPYLGRRVGIAGNRGFIPEFNRAHVTAGRVTPLSERMVR
ncbi:MAG: SH3 domain-containing protein [Planctomycetes bacterium]|nr:SH3 domain-containing protein [Planctomycetota bacterium]